MVVERDVEGPPPGAVEAARDAPGGWVYEIDGCFGPDELVPPEVIKGAWPVGLDGVISGPFESNPEFRPRPD